MILNHFTFKIIPDNLILRRYYIYTSMRLIVLIIKIFNCFESRIMYARIIKFNAKNMIIKLKTRNKIISCNLLHVQNIEYKIFIKLYITLYTLSFY